MTLPLSMRVVCFGGTASSALVYGVVPMVEMAHMVVAASLTILAPGLFVEVIPLCGGGGGLCRGLCHGHVGFCPLWGWGVIRTLPLAVVESLAHFAP